MSASVEKEASASAGRLAEGGLTDEVSRGVAEVFEASVGLTFFGTRGVGGAVCAPGLRPSCPD